MAARDRRVAVIGGGIAGLTTAILLHANGYPTHLYTKLAPSNKPDESREPEFASLHAAASVLPHSVTSPNVAAWTSISQQFFRALSFRATCGVRSQVHYEIFENQAVPRPEYADAVDNFEMLTDSDLESRWIPRRGGATALAGWRFDAFFCEAPEYIRYLSSLYRAIGGRIEEHELPGDHLLAYLGLNYHYYVNCTGSGAHAFVGAPLEEKAFQDMYSDEPGPADTSLHFAALRDEYPPKLIRGHYLRVDIKEMITGPHGRFFSYNYKPTADVYRNAQGAPADVYCYPRSDAWILGGSRQEGVQLDSGEWDWDGTVGNTREFAKIDGGDLRVPAPIFDLNAELLLRLTDGRLDLARLYADEPSLVSPGVGYRFVRDSPSDSIRVAVSRVRVRRPGSDASKHKYVFHNYGHGGSGFTLSWGCAFQILEMLECVTGRQSRVHVKPQRRKFLDTHTATKDLLLALTARLREARC